MSKQEFLMLLRKGLSGLPQEDIEERVTFYSEMIDDRTEEGLSEEEAVSAVGSVDDIVAQIKADAPEHTREEESVRSEKRFKAWEIALLALGSPIWLSLGCAAVVVALSFCASVFAVVASLWAVFAALIGCALGGVAAGIVLVCVGYTASGIALLGAGALCAGISIFAFFCCKAATKGLVTLVKKAVFEVKTRFVRRNKDE